MSVDGRDLASLTRAEVAREVAYVPQASSSYFDFSLVEMVEMGRTAHLGVFARPGARDRDIARAALERMGIGALGERPVSGVSGGERQLALIARALATEARALVMDEPTANLDFGNQSRRRSGIARLRDGGIAVLLCSHDPDHAFLVADRALLLERGHEKARRAPPRTSCARRTSRLYGVSVHVAEGGHAHRATASSRTPAYLNPPRLPGVYRLGFDGKKRLQGRSGEQAG